MADQQTADLNTLFGVIDELTGTDPEPVQRAFQYVLGQILVERGLATAAEETGERLVLHGSGGLVKIVPRPAGLGASQAEMVKEHLGWLLRDYLP